MKKKPVSPSPFTLHPSPVIAIDGPGGVGKGTVARALAGSLGWHLLDSGALYRILALAASRAGLDLEQAPAVSALARKLDIRFRVLADGAEQILLDGADVTADVRAETTGNLASAIAVYPEVRAALLKRQRDFRQSPGLVADGRDMGTVVFPDAALKIFLDASPEERARRRHRQLSAAGVTANLSGLCTEIRARDERDRNRDHAPLKPAEDAVTLDTTELTVQQVIGRVEELIKARHLK